jgi:mono/diheme cytochrome c family protein
MLRRLPLVVLILALITGGAFLLTTMPRPLDVGVLPDHAPDPENGRTMFWIGGCASCHAAPGAEGGARLRLAGGVELDTPFGVFRTPNLSPDPEHGIGAWSTIDFVNAMVRGLSPNGRHYYPAFPYPHYQRMRYEDLIDLKAFLDTLPPVPGTVPDHDLAFPFNVRRGLGLWKLRYLDGRTFDADPSAPPVVERGRYLVEGPGHCGACHTPRDRFGGEVRERHLAGAKLLDASDAPEGEGRVPNITPHEDGIGEWTQNDIAYSLESGLTPEFDSFGGSMVEVQANLAMVPLEERAAIAAYLKSLPGLPSEPD